jgi:hypothetical protein
MKKHDVKRTTSVARNAIVYIYKQTIRLYNINGRENLYSVSLCSKLVSEVTDTANEPTF